MMLQVALRMMFEGAPNLSQWSDVSEVINNLANDYVRRSDMDSGSWSPPAMGPADKQSGRQQRRTCKHGR